MQQHRIFIAINFSKEIREQLFELNAKWSDLPFRFTHFNDIHITLIFIGALDEEYLLKALDVLKNVGEQCEPFEIKLTDIILAPTLKNAKFIWLNTDASAALEALHKKVTEALREAGIRFKSDYYPYRPHVTLARRLKAVKPYSHKAISQEGDGVLHGALNLTVKVNSFEVMESFLSKKGSKYQIIQSYTLGS